MSASPTAHEINTPLAVIRSDLGAMEQYVALPIRHESLSGTHTTAVLA